MPGLAWFFIIGLPLYKIAQKGIVRTFQQLRLITRLTVVSHPLTDLFDGKWDFKQPSDWQEWVHRWLQAEGAMARLNQSQQHALQLPFQYALSLI